jgi:hypothetical protein
MKVKGRAAESVFLSYLLLVFLGPLSSNGLYSFLWSSYVLAMSFLLSLLLRGCPEAGLSNGFRK